MCGLYSSVGMHSSLVGMHSSLVGKLPGAHPVYIKLPWNCEEAAGYGIVRVCTTGAALRGKASQNVAQGATAASRGSTLGVRIRRTKLHSLFYGSMDRNGQGWATRGTESHCTDDACSPR